MLNAIITANEQTAVIEFPIARYELQRQLNQIGLRCGAHRIRLTDHEDDNIQVKLYADNVMDDDIYHTPEEHKMEM